MRSTVPFVTALLLVAGTLFFTGCASYTFGSKNDSEENGSYSGYTLNSPVTDQNPHVGGDSSYPASVSDQGKPLATPDKVDGR